MIVINVVDLFVCYGSMPFKNIDEFW